MTVVAVEQTRGPGLGASMAAACLGVSPYKSRIGAWLQLKGRARDIAGPQAEWGNILEPVIRGYYAARHGYSVGGDSSRDIIVPTDSLYHHRLPWLRATPDGIARLFIPSDDLPRFIDPGSPERSDRWRDTHLVQCKNVDGHLSWQWGPRSARTPPPHYRIQAIVEMAVTGLDRCDFAVLLGGNEYFDCIVERDLDLEADIIARLEAFWSSVERNNPPPIDDASEWRDYFADRLPRESNRVPADSETLGLVDRWRAIRDVGSKAERDEAEIKNLILAAAVRDGATKFETQHGDVLIVQPKGKAPYVKAPAQWGEEKAS